MNRLSLIQIEAEVLVPVLNNFSIEQLSLLCPGVKLAVSDSAYMRTAGEVLTGRISDRTYFNILKDESMESFLKALPVRLDVKLGEAEMTAQDFINLKPGDHLEIHNGRLLSLEYGGETIAYGSLNDGIFEILETVEDKESITK